MLAAGAPFPLSAAVPPRPGPAAGPVPQGRAGHVAAVEHVPGRAERRVGGHRGHPPAGRGENPRCLVCFPGHRGARPLGGPGGDGEQQGHGRAGGPPGGGQMPCLASAQVAGDHDEQPAGVRGQLRQPGAQRGVPRWPDDGEGVQEHVLERAGRGDTAGVGDELGVHLLARQVHPDGRGGADRIFEGRDRAPAAVAAEAGVQEQHRTVPPALLLPAHHELPVPCGGAPVHPAKLVAVPVGARHHVVLARRGRRAGAGVALAEPGSGEGGVRERGDRRGDHQGARRSRHAPYLRQAEGVRHPDLQRADGVLAPVIGLDGVAQPARAARLDPVQDEPRPAADRVGHGVLGQQQPGGQPGHVVELDGHRSGVAGRHARRADSPGPADPVPGPARGQHGQHRQDDQHSADAEQGALAEPEAEHARGCSCGNKSPAAGGESGQHRPHAAPFLEPALLKLRTSSRRCQV